MGSMNMPIILKRLVQLTAISNSIVFQGVFAGTLHMVEDFKGLHNYVACNEGFKAVCGDTIEKNTADYCYKTTKTEAFCQLPVVETGLFDGAAMECITKSCIRRGNDTQPDCDRSSKRSKKCQINKKISINEEVSVDDLGSIQQNILLGKFGVTERIFYAKYNFVKATLASDRKKVKKLEEII